MTADRMPTKGPKTIRLAEARLYQLMFMSHMIDSDTFCLDVARKEIQDAWHTLKMNLETEAPKEKATRYLDRAVIAIFRNMGKGYQTRVNRVLETWLVVKIESIGREVRT